LAFAFPPYSDPPGSKVHPRRDDSIETLQGALDRCDAGGAARLRYRKVRLKNAVAEVSAGK
jgi:hypothetical protein